MTERRFKSVWDAIETSPADAAAMKVRADLMIAIREVIDSWRSTQVRVPRRSSASRSRDSTTFFAVRSTSSASMRLMNLAERAGLAVRVKSFAALPEST